MASWYQKGRDGSDVALASGRIVGGMFGVKKIRGYRQWRYQIDHVPSGAKVVEVNGWDYSMHLRLAKVLVQVIASRDYGDANPWHCKSKPGKADLDVMKRDLNEARDMVMGAASAGYLD